MIKAKQQRRVNRKTVQTGTLPTAPIVSVVSVTATAPSTVTIVFNSAVQVSSDNLPTSWIFGTGSHHISSLTSGAGNTWVFVVDGTIAAAQVYAIAGNDPAVRTSTGGYVGSHSGVMS